MQSVVFSSASNPLRNGFGLLHTGVERHQDEEGKVQNGAYLRQQRTARGSRDSAQDTEDHEADTEDCQPQLAQPALVADRFDRAAIQPGQDEQHSNGSTHGQHTRERGAGDGRNGTQDGVEGREVPYRSNMVRGLQRVGDLEVRLLQEVATHLREEEHHGAEDEQEHRNTDNILHGVVRVEGNAIQRHAVLVLLGLVVLHIIALHEVGSTNPDGIVVKKLKDENGVPLDGIPFHPYYTVKDIVGVAVFLFVFCTVVFFFPEMGGYFLEKPNFEISNPLKTPDHIAPVWYFTPFYAILRAVPAIAGSAFPGVLAMGAAIAVLFVLPWLDRSPVKSIRYKGWLSKLWLVIFCVSFVVLGVLGAIPATPGRTLLSQVCTVLYFAFFILMPFYTRMEKTKPVPERVTG